ncbi:MAG: tRNA (adenosine(37)-N6)-dimethylallyltransferase MiaA [Verrucomicrobiaceae bacterium]|jgi:tRNA dimethylallyltransferase|nr:tRNA (adenosine(37)-N6)-dimethylallyltransferase MiaA [Verrucomicrobiaceae bacterium]
MPSNATFFIAGPTASGKSALAVELAARVGGEIVNADAFQLYAGLDILTAKPSMEERARVPHHLYGVLPLTDTCDAQRFHDLAVPVIADIQARGKAPIVTGGSGLYLKALTHGLAPLPRGDERMRAELRARPLEDKVAELLRLDPEAAATVNLRNPRYVERALEICLLSGEPQSRLRQSFAGAGTHVRGVVLDWERQALCARIDARTRRMFGLGIVDEVAAAGELSATTEKAIGVREIRALLAGQATLEQTVTAMQTATRQYAKRQATWFRRERCFQTICLDSSSAADYPLESALQVFHEGNPDS